MSRAHRLAPWLALALLGSVLVVGRASLRTSRDGLDGLLYSADFLSPAALYQDVVIDGRPLAGYQFSAATFAVPDQLVYAAARSATLRTGICRSTGTEIAYWLFSQKKITGSFQTAAKFSASWKSPFEAAPSPK